MTKQHTATALADAPEVGAEATEKAASVRRLLGGIQFGAFSISLVETQRHD